MSNKLAGVYGIFNIKKWKVYIGQAKKGFDKRTHLLELERGTDSTDLQKDFQTTPDIFLFFPIYTEEIYNAETAQETEKEYNKRISEYEKFFIYFMQAEYGFEVYNKAHKGIRLKQIDISTILHTNQAELEDKAKYEIKKSFSLRFGKTAKQLKKFKDNKVELEKAINVYLNKRRFNSVFNENILPYKREIRYDRVIYNRDFFKNLLSIESVTPLNLDEMVYTKAGNYVGLGFDQIIYYEKELINKYGRCLWTLQSNAFSERIVRDYCKKREDNGQSAYVIFKYTSSPTYADVKGEDHRILSKMGAKELDIIRQKNPQDKIFKVLYYNNVTQKYEVAPDVDCTSTSSKATMALVIESIDLLDVKIDEEALKKNYKALDQFGYQYEIGGSSRGTFYIKNITTTGVPTESPDDRSFYFIGKLAAPYVVRLENRV